MKYLALACLIFSSNPTLATILNFDNNGSLVGASGVEVGGTRFNVEFSDGSCEEVFGLCAASNFAFSTETEALQATRALFDQVLLADPFLDVVLTTGPGAVEGCPFVFACGLLTPFGTQDEFVNVVFGNLLGGRDTMGQTGSFSTLITDDDSISGYVRWTALEASAPAMLSLLLLGFGLLSASGFRASISTSISE